MPSAVTLNITLELYIGKFCPSLNRKTGIFCSKREYFTVYKQLPVPGYQIFFMGSLQSFKMEISLN